MFLIKNLKLKNGVSINWEWNGAPVQIDGPNGCGKSLLLKALAQLYPGLYDVFLFQELPVRLYDPQLYRSQVLYIPPLSSFMECNSVKDFMEQPLRLKIYKGYQPIPEYSLLLKSWGMEKKLISELSSGEKQIISLLRGLALKAKVLLLDETFAHIDQEKKKFLLHLLLNKTREQLQSFILISHESFSEDFPDLKKIHFSKLSQLTADSSTPPLQS